MAAKAVSTDDVELTGVKPEGQWSTREMSVRAESNKFGGQTRGNYAKDETYEPCLWDNSKKDWCIMTAIFIVLYFFLLLFFYVLKMFNE